MRIRFNLQSTKIIGLFVCIYRYLLDYSYFTFVSPLNHYSLAYAFFDYRTNISFFVSWLMVLISFPFLKCFFDGNRAYGSTLIVFFIYLLSYLPFTTCVYAGIISEQCAVYNFVYFLFLFTLHRIICGGATKKVRLIRFGKLLLNDKIVFVLTGIMALMVIYVWLRYANGRMIFDFLETAYKWRMEERSYQYPLWLSYSLAMSSNIIPFVFGYCIICKLHVFATVLWVVQFLHFCIGGEKNVFFTPLVVLIILGICSRLSITQFKMATIISLIGMNVFGIIENYLYGISMIVNEIINRRLFFLPQHFKEVYFRYFQMNEPDYFRSSFLRHFGFESPYAPYGGVPRAIGHFLDAPAMNANNGLFSDAIANMGLPGIILMPVVLVFVLWLFDICTANVDKRLVAVAAMQISLCLIDSALGTLLLSHGALLLMICMLLMGQREDEKIL